MYKTENLLFVMAIAFVVMVVLGNFYVKEEPKKPVARSIIVVVDSVNRYKGIYSQRCNNWSIRRSPDTCRMFEVEALLLKEDLKKNNSGYDFRVIPINHYGKTIRDLK
jgi:hypothetical protein